MRTVQIGTMRVELYDAIEELPMRRFHKYNKMLLVDSGIGSDMADFDRHIEKIIAYCKSKNPELAAVELDNMRQNVYYIQTGLSPRHMAFAVLVKSIDGKPCEDISDEGLQKTVAMFADVPIVEIAAQNGTVKKKIDDELQLYFPKVFDDASVKEYYDELRRRTLLVLDAVINGEDERKAAELDRVTMELLLYNKPRSFGGSENMEVKYDKQFERMCLMLSQYLNIDPKCYTVLEYYNAFEYIREEIKNKSKAYGLNKARTAAF